MQVMKQYFLFFFFLETKVMKQYNGGVRGKDMEYQMRVHAG